jgi:hypothetical protein
MKNQNQQRTLLEQKLIEKAMKDETFRKQLLENPREIVEQETGMKLPASIAIHVLEEKANEVFLVLPAIKTETGEELTEAELSNVAGGIPPPVATEDWSCSCFC